MPSRTTDWSAAETFPDWSSSYDTVMSSGTSDWNLARLAFTSLTTASVDASGRLVTGM